MKNLYIIIPVYNTERYLRRCVDSAIEQTYENIKIILVDDGSTDGSPLICDEYERRYRRVRVIHTANAGLSEARNAGMRMAFGTADDNDYICFLDSDDFIRPDFAERMIGLCEKFECGAAQCSYEKGMEDEFPERKKRYKDHAEESKKALLGYELRSFACAKIYRRAALAGITFPKGVWNEDEFTTYRAVYACGRIAFTNEPLYYYFQRPGSIMDDIAKKLRDNPHRRDWLTAYDERSRFFEVRGMTDQILRTREKICSDIILRYSEQMRLPAEERDRDCVDGKYLDIYRRNFKSMIRRRKMPLSRRLIYTVFRFAPGSAAAAGRVKALRK